jgi:DNA-binding transcriptional regulator YbjK
MSPQDEASMHFTFADFGDLVQRNGAHFVVRQLKNEYPKLWSDLTKAAEPATIIKRIELERV